ncbi:MAG: hypothetical protein JNL50_03605 [Phycisphaerae bacterium]|nr:hypothetical protein [Phycisphaerae bacterium]
MLVLNPGEVVFAGEVWGRVKSVAIDRIAEEVIAARGDGGAEVVFADVPSVRVNVKVVREMHESDLGSPRPGQSAVLLFVTSLGASDAKKKTISMQAVVTNVRHEVGARGATRIVEFVALSADGHSDPVSVS